MAKLQPLNKNKALHVEKKRIIVQSIGMSVLTLHAGTWQAGVHKQMYELAKDMDSPMPTELMYIQRLRLLFHLMQAADEYIIHSVLNSFALCGKQSWLYGTIKAVDWMRRQMDNMLLPEELSELGELATWHDFSPFAGKLKGSLKKAKRSHPQGQNLL